MTYQSAKTADDVRHGEVDANIDAILSDRKPVANILLAAERAGLNDDTSPVVSIIRRSGQSHTLRSARQNGDVTTMNTATGLSESSVEATGYDLLIKRCTPAAQQILLKGEKGSGKTVLAIDIAREMYAHFDGKLSIATNIKGPDEHDAVTLVETMSEMLEWVRDTPGEKLVIGDEWSTTMNAHANPGGNVRQTVSRFINALRKGRGGSTRLLIIGHQHSTDIAAILRTQSDVVIQKAGKADEGLASRAHVYDGWSDYQKQDKALTIRGLQDVPKSSVWGADTNYFAHFEIDLDNPREQIKRGKLVDNWRDYQDDAEQDTNDDPQLRACRGTKTSGDDCGATVKHVSGYCYSHRAQWDGDDDPRLTGGDDR